MKYIKSYEQHSSSKEVNESIIAGGNKKSWLNAIEGLIFLPLTTLATIAANLSSPRIITKIAVDKYLPIYNNINKIIEIVKNMIEKSEYDLTDSEIRKAKKILGELELVKKKYPTLEDYKKFIKKVVPIFNIRNASYLKRKIDEYEPSKLSTDELENVIKKISKEVSHDRQLMFQLTHDED